MIVGTLLAKWDRPSFDEWFPQNLAEQFEMVDYLHVRVDRETADRVVPHFEPYGDWLSWELQNEGPRFQEDDERQALLQWAIDSGAEWVYCSDADEVLEPGSGKHLRDFVLRNKAKKRTYRLWLSYSSHHRKGFILPRCVCAWRFFKLDNYAKTFRFQADEDGLHCGTVPHPHVGDATIKPVHLIHYHATSCAEYMAERAFYDNTGEVERNGGIDFLYRCERFGNEADAYPESDLERDREERYARLAR